MAPRFTLRTLFLIVGISAVCAWMMRTSDWLAAMGFGLAALAALVAAKMRPSPRHLRLSRCLRCSLFLAACTLTWFSTVDRSNWYESCPGCRDHRFVTELRVCGLPIDTTHYPFHIDTRSRIRGDLGMPCDHRFEREHIVRLWGLAICARPCMGVTCCVYNDPAYYNVEVARRTRRFAAAHPREARELCARIVNHDDFDAMHAFIAKMKAGDTEREHEDRVGTAEDGRP